MSNLPSKAKVVILGGGIHGLSTAWHLAEKLKESALKTGFPERIRPAWAKNSSDKIIPIAKELQNGGILGAVTLAVQSLDKETLNIMRHGQYLLS